MFLTRFKDWIHKQQLFSSGDRILVGVSGGVDSLALLDSLHALSKEGGWEIFAAHLNHQFRGEESKGDAQFVRDFCAIRNIPCEIGERDVPGYIKDHHVNPQEASRLLRYSFYHEVSKQWNINKLALAHHANDQAETVLMRIIRGTGIDGLAGIPQTRVEKGLTIVRPFLPFYKSDLELYCKERGMTPRLDSSNLKTKYHRNLLRLKILPWLEEQLGPGIQDSLVHLADIADGENRFMEQIIKEKTKEIIKSRKNNKIVIKGKLFSECHLALQRRMIKLIFNYLLLKEENLGFIHINQLCEWIRNGRTGTKRELPLGVTAWKEYEDVIFITESTYNDTGSYSYSLEIPGRIYIEELGVWVTTQIHPSDYIYSHKTGYLGTFDADQIPGPLYLRTRRNGDRMTLLGMQGSKKVKDILIDAKVPRRLRSIMPILATSDHILWIPGVKRSNLATKTSSTKQILTIHIEQMVEI
ncbi:MAG TPA: tRNA lysidine(34) synthetase TilS [Bacillota bacterium]|nr:tRNA lysidine(34) synthetase TilS [Bacillota bacterium]